jgi:hypothetical protein
MTDRTVTLSYLLPRIDRGSVTDVGKLELTVSKDDARTPAKIFEAFKSAMATWINETQEGKDLWADSSEDLNIGDLSMAEPDIDEYLKAHDIFGYEASVLSAENSEYHFDTVLVERDEVKELEDD